MTTVRWQACGPPSRPVSPGDEDDLVPVRVPQGGGDRVSFIVVDGPKSDEAIFNGSSSRTNSATTST
jgi:hypothetical protein